MLWVFSVVAPLEGCRQAAGNYRPAACAPQNQRAVRKIEAASQEKMAGLSAGLGLPPGMKLPF